MSERERKLIEEGWERRLIACEPKLSEIADLYREIGFEVLVVPLSEVMDESCEEKECTYCYDLDKEKYMVIYTKPKY